MNQHLISNLRTRMEKNGYIWTEKVKMFIQGKDANNTIREIIRLSIINNYTFDIEIQLQNNEIIRYIYE